MGEVDSVNTFLLNRNDHLCVKFQKVYIYQDSIFTYSCENCFFVKYYVTSTVISYRNAVLEVIWFYRAILI